MGINAMEEALKGCSIFKLNTQAKGILTEQGVGEKLCASSPDPESWLALDFFCW